MNCFNHIEENAVASCQDCQKGLCNECASLYTFPICTQCNSQRKQFQKKVIYKELLLMFVFGCILYYLLLQIYTPVNSSLLEGGIFEKVFLVVSGFYLGGALIAGWKTLTYITPNIFLFLPLVGWLIYFIVKFLLSIAVGLVMFPVRLFRNFRKIYLLNRT